jgi:hypothetical protein
MKIEGYTPKDLHNIVTLGNAIRVRQVYEDSRLDHPDKDTVMVTHGQDRKLKVDSVIYTIFTGIEAGARQELYAAGHHHVVEEIYKVKARTIDGEANTQ